MFTEFFVRVLDAYSACNWPICLQYTHQKLCVNLPLDWLTWGLGPVTCRVVGSHFWLAGPIDCDWPARRRFRLKWTLWSHNKMAATIYNVTQTIALIRPIYHSGLHFSSTDTAHHHYTALWVMKNMLYPPPKKTRLYRTRSLLIIRTVN